MEESCTAVRCWRTATYKIVGTSTNCSAICSALSTVREQREGVEIEGTSITCSGRTGSSTPRIFSTSNWSTICGMRASRTCTTGAEGSCSATGRGNTTCVPCGSANEAGRVPGGGAFCRRGALYFTCSSTSLMAVAVVCPFEDWCLASATAIATAIRPWRRNERRRPSRLRLAAELTGSRAADMAARLGLVNTHTRTTRTCAPEWPHCCEQPLNRDAWWWWWWFRRCDNSDVFVDTIACVHLIRVAEHPGVRLPASPPPGTHVQLDGVRKMPQK